MDFTIPGLTFDTHLFGVDEGGIHLFGTDKAGKDLFSRTLSAIYISLAVGTLGVFISFVLSLIIGEFRVIMVVGLIVYFKCLLMQFERFHQYLSLCVLLLLHH